MFVSTPFNSVMYCSYALLYYLVIENYSITGGFVETFPIILHIPVVLFHGQTLCLNKDFISLIEAYYTGIVN